MNKEQKKEVVSIVINEQRIRKKSSLFREKEQ
jgi:hypothetical protein